MSEQPTPEKRKWRLTRRHLLIGLGLGGGALALGLPALRLRVARWADKGSMPGAGEQEPLAWFEVLPDNRVRLHVPKVEMGQGIHTSLAQLAAEELEVPWERLEVVNASTAHGPVDPRGTSGSQSVASLFTPLREAAATLREMLRAEAARLLSVPLASVVAEAGVLSVQGQRKLTYGEVVAQRKAPWEVPEEPPALKPAKDFKYIGQSLPRVDLEAKLTGQPVYGYDQRLPGMLYGAVARPPRLGSTLLSAREGRARQQPGVVAVVVDKDFAGVAAESRAQAYAALAHLELEWSEGESIGQAELNALTTVREGEGTLIQDEGDVSQYLERGSVLEAEYRTPMVAHAHLEPQAALVEAGPERVRVWMSTQSAARVRKLVAQALGRKEEAVEVTATYLGGGFGRRITAEPALEAARLSQAAGRPVHVGWSREEEFHHGFFRPPTHHRLRGVLKEESGRVLALEHQQASGDVLFAFLPEVAAYLLGADLGAWRGATLRYGIAHRRTRAQRVKLPVPTSTWRGLGLLANTFAIESFMDELAHAAGKDPLAFRLSHLPEDELGRRWRRVLEAAAERAGWGTPAPEGRARGIACSMDVHTLVAQVAEVSVEGERVRVHRFTSAVDCGLVINPDGALAQVEGSILMGLGSTLYEQVNIKDGKVDVDNFYHYPLPTMEDAPELETVLVGEGETPYGMGEPPIGPVAAAVANAVFALTGKRLRSLPLRLE